MTRATHREGNTTAIAGLSLLAGLAALLGVSCCVLPLALALVGLGGAWLAQLDIFVAYGGYLLAGAALAVAGGWIAAWRRGATRLARWLLVVASATIVLALLVRIFEPELNRLLGALWRDA